MERRGVIKLLMSVMGLSLTASATATATGSELTKNGSKKILSDAEINKKKPNNIDEIVNEKGYVDPEDFGAIKLVNNNDLPDSTIAFQAAINYAEENGYGEVRFSGKYFIGRALHKIKLPGDDGSLSPAFGIKDDARIPEEDPKYVLACLKISDDIILSGRNPAKDMLVSDWYIDKSPIDINQKIGIAITSEKENRNTTRYSLTNFSMCNFFIARIVFSISENTFESLNLINCGISGIKLGLERCNEGVMTYSGCISGDVIGGWWTNRNSTSQDNKYLPPYPARDVNAVGWIDFSYTEEIQYAQISGKFSVRHELIDLFFDTYFFKSKNSIRTSKGGRLSNSDAPNPAIIPEYYGIAGRARTYISRYGRPISAVVINRLKTLGCHRTPITLFSSKAFNCYINDAYVERTGLIDNTIQSTQNNYFGIDLDDKYRNKKSGVIYNVAQGFDVKNIILSTGNQTSKANDKASVTYTKNLVIDNLNLMNDGIENYLSITSYDGKKIKEEYKMDSENFYSKPIIFPGNKKAFSTESSSFKPKLSATTLNPVGKYIKIGELVNVEIRIEKLDIKDLRDNLTLTNLPHEPDEFSMLQLGTIKIDGLKENINLSGYVSEKAIIFTKDSSGKKITRDDFTALVSSDVILSFSYIRA